MTKEKVTQEHFKLVDDILPKIQKISRYMEKKFRLKRGELLGAAWEGALDAAVKFKEDNNNKFYTYAFYRIIGNIKDYMRSVDSLSRKNRSNKKNHKEYINLLPLYMFVDEIVDEHNYIHDIIIKDLVNHVISTCPSRLSDIVKLYHFDNLTFKEIGKIYNINESRACQLYHSALELIRRKLGIKNGN